jgi:hypothetical protein
MTMHARSGSAHVVTASHPSPEPVIQHHPSLPCCLARAAASATRPQMGADGMVMGYGQKAAVRGISLGMLFIAQTMPAGVLVYW